MNVYHLDAHATIETASGVAWIGTLLEYVVPTLCYANAAISWNSTEQSFFSACCIVLQLLKCIILYVIIFTLFKLQFKRLLNIED